MEIKHYHFSIWLRRLHLLSIGRLNTCIGLCQNIEGRIAHALTKTSSEDGRFRKLAQHHQAAGHVAHRALNGDHTHCPFTTARRPWWRDVKLLRNVALDLRPWSSRFVYISLSRITLWGKRVVSRCFVLTIFSLEHHKDRKSNVCTFLRKWKSGSFPLFYPPQISRN